MTWHFFVVLLVTVEMPIAVPENTGVPSKKRHFPPDLAQTPTQSGSQRSPTFGVFVVLRLLQMHLRLLETLLSSAKTSRQPRQRSTCHRPTSIPKCHFHKLRKKFMAWKQPDFSCAENFAKGGCSNVHIRQQHRCHDTLLPQVERRSSQWTDGIVSL